MGLFSSLFRKSKTDSVSPLPENVVTYYTTNQWEKSFSTAKVVDGTVHCIGYSSPFVVGSYEQETESTFIVWNDGHTQRIGQIDLANRTIMLTISDSWVHIKKLNPYTPAPKRFTYLAASWYGNTICDEETRQPVASFTGDPVAAAAAFVCLTYEVLTENKYYNFFNWNK